MSASWTSAMTSSGSRSVGESASRLCATTGVVFGCGSNSLTLMYLGQFLDAI